MWFHSIILFNGMAFHIHSLLWVLYVDQSGKWQLIIPNHLPLMKSWNPVNSVDQWNIMQGMYGSWWLDSVYSFGLIENNLNCLAVVMNCLHRVLAWNAYVLLPSFWYAYALTPCFVFLSGSRFLKLWVLTQMSLSQRFIAFAQIQV